MNFSPHSSIYNSASQQQSQQQAMNNYNSGTFYQNMMPTFTGYPYCANSYPFSPVNYPPQQSCNYNTNSFYTGNYPLKTTETTTQGPKREYKPLTVIDPQRNEEIDLIEASKTHKSNSLLDEVKHENYNSKVSVSLNNIIVSGKREVETTNLKEQASSYEDEHEEADDDFDEESGDGDRDMTDEYERESSENEDHNDIDIQTQPTVVISDVQTNLDDIISHQGHIPTIKYSQSIPNEMDTLSISADNIQALETSASENNLYNKSINDITETQKEIERSRLIYDRNTLLNIFESSSCPKPDFECKEIIENHEMKPYQIVWRQRISTTLVRSKHGYLPPHLRLKEECNQNKYLDTLRRNFKCILNKIAPQNFDVCFLDIKKLISDTDWTNISVKDGMDCIIEEIFDKAVQEEAYSVTYANLCTKMVIYEEKQETKWNFKISLINRCKDMFETPLQDQLKSVRNHWELKVENEKNEKLKNLYRSDIEEQVKKAKDKYFGNIRFIGELYLHDLLKVIIINTCVMTLMSKVNDEDALFSLCKLLETVGKKFDTKHNDKMKEYISSIRNIFEQQNLSTRIKFRLVDIIEMSQRNWSLRTIQAQKIIRPKTLAEVKKDDLEEKTLEASKLSNKLQTRLTKKNNNSADIKLKPQQNKMQSLEIANLQMQPSGNIELKPSYGKWKSGSGVKEPEWKNVEGKKTTRYSKYNSKYTLQNNKGSPVTSRDESPSKVDIGGRFALLQHDDMDNIVDTKDSRLTVQDQTSDSEKLRQSDRASSSSTREQSPSNMEYSSHKLLDSEEIFEILLDSGVLDVQSWCQITDTSQTVANWLDWIMEKSKQTRNMVGDQLAKLLSNNKLSMEDLSEGLKKFSEEIDDLKTDIPLIWNFLAEFLERFIVDSKSDINFYKVLIDSSGSRQNVADCIAMCLHNADQRVGHSVIKSVIEDCNWTLKDIVDDDIVFLRSRELTFLVEDSPQNPTYFDKYQDDLLSLLPNDDDEVNQFLIETFGLEMTQTEQCVYFVSNCVFIYLSNLLAVDITKYLCDRKLFFVRLLDRRSEFEKQTLDALCDSSKLFNETGLMAVINCLRYILSYDAFQQFLQRDQCNNESTMTLDSSKGNLATDVYRAILERTRR